MAEPTDDVLEKLLEVVRQELQKAFGDFVLLGEDPKYGQVFATKGSRAHAGEPMMLLRGRDSIATKAIDAYANAANNSGSSIEHVTSVAAVHQRFRDWQGSNGDKTHLPT